MDNYKPIKQELYIKHDTDGSQVLEFFTCVNQSGIGHDYILKYKVPGDIEFAHIILYPSVEIDIEIKPNKKAKYLREFVETNMEGFTPSPSKKLLEFIKTFNDAFRKEI